MSVIRAGKLDDHRAAGGRSRDAHRAHRRFGAGDDEADHLAAGHAGGDAFGELDLLRRGEAEQHAVRQRLGERALDGGVGVPEQRRSPRADPVDVAPAALVEHVSAARFDDGERRRAHRLEGADRRMHAAGRDAFRTLDPRRCYGRAVTALTTSLIAWAESFVAISRAK